MHQTVQCMERIYQHPLKNTYMPMFTQVKSHIYCYVLSRLYYMSKGLHIIEKKKLKWCVQINWGFSGSSEGNKSLGDGLVDL